MLNSLIGDLGALGAGDDECERIAAHLRFVHGMLARASVSHLSPAQRAARAELLARLAAYAGAREFPRAACTRRRLPVFVDPLGPRCAVAELVAHAEGPRAAHAIDAEFHTARVADMTHPAIASLCAASGLAPIELALIQPEYGFMPPEPPPAIQWLAGAEAATAAASARTDSPARALALGELRWLPHHNEYIGDAIVELEAAAGAESGGRVPYAFSLRAGTEAHWYPGELVGGCASGCSAHRTGIVAGVRVDADGSRIPQAWTVPIDAHWYVPWFGSSNSLGAVGGPRIRFAGADRDLGWSAGLDFAHELDRGLHWSAPNELHIGVAVEQLADLAFVGVTLALASRDRYVLRGL